jgi:hypothetical protein
VCLIDCEERDGQVAEEIEVLLFGECFRGNIEQLCFSGKQVLPNGFYLALVEGGVQEVGDFIVFAVATHQVNLVLHQGNEGRYDDGAARTDQGGELVAKTFAAAGGHDDKGIPATQQTIDGLLLGASELGEPEILFEGGMYGRVRTLAAACLFGGGLLLFGCCLFVGCCGHVFELFLNPGGVE